MVKEGICEFIKTKLSLLLKLKYNNAVQDDIANLGQLKEIGRIFTVFQKYLYTVDA